MSYAPVVLDGDDETEGSLVRTADRLGTPASSPPRSRIGDIRMRDVYRGFAVVAVLAVAATAVVMALPSGPDEAGAILRRIVAPFSDLGVAGAITTKSRRTGGTDHTSFNAAGLPGIGTQLDPMEYQTHTWHTNLDTYERIIEDDVKAQAAVIAAVVYELSMRDQLLPRFSKDDMPKPPEAPAAPTPAPSPTPTAGAR